MAALPQHMAISISNCLKGNKEGSGIVNNLTCIGQVHPLSLNGLHRANYWAIDGNQRGCKHSSNIEMICEWTWKKKKKNLCEGLLHRSGGVVVSLNSNKMMISHW